MFRPRASLRRLKLSVLWERRASTSRVEPTQPHSSRQNAQPFPVPTRSTVPGIVSSLMR
ncbi:CRISPR-associated protein Cas5 [Streptomyces sp. A0592]|nr:CRISPR-associated protein Cas5 [Streptomyces sp. A0592]